MHCAPVIVILQYGHCEDWWYILITNIINVVRQYKPFFYKQCARCKIYIYAQKTLPHCNSTWCGVILNSYARESKICHRGFGHTDVYKRIKRCYKCLKVWSDNNIEQYELNLLQTVFWKLSSKLKTLQSVNLTTRNWKCFL
jgi:hypothetical protein